MSLGLWGGEEPSHRKSVVSKDKPAGSRCERDTPKAQSHDMQGSVMGGVRFFFWSLYIGLLLICSGAVFFVIGYGYPMLQDHLRQLPGIEVVNDYRPDLGSMLYDADGRPIAEFYKERRKLVRFEELPTHLVNALVATEDQQFYRHNGVNPVRIFKAAYNNFSGSSQQGGSTITQQIAKDIFVGWEKTYQRKLNEALYAMKIEQELSKQEILSIYFNQVMFGHNTRGIRAAAEFYFGKDPTELNLAECATLVGLLKANTAYSPILNPERSRQRRVVVLQLMLDCGYITEEEFQEASQAELTSKRKDSEIKGQLDPYPHWRSFVTNDLLLRPNRMTRAPLTSDRVDLDTESLYTGGLKIRTTLDPTMQTWAEEAVRNALRSQEQIRRKNRPGWGLQEQDRPRFANSLAENARLLGKIRTRKATSELEIELIDVPGKPKIVFPNPGNRDWREEFGVLDADFYVPIVCRKSKTSDSEDLGIVQHEGYSLSLLDQHKDQHAEAALVCLEVGTGRILSWVGGYGWYLELPQSRRIRCREGFQPGSSFKPIVFSYALEHGYTPSTRISNEPYSRKLANGRVWTPTNYTKSDVGGTVQLREVLVRSLNIPTIRVFENLLRGAFVTDPFTGQETLEIARRMGIKSVIPRELAVALGTADISPLEMATAFSVFANMGTLVEPYGIESIETRDGQIAYINRVSGQPDALDQVTAFLMTDIMAGVLRDRRGTGYRRAHDFPFPIAGKTGTTNQYFDAWFVGYSRNLVTAVWVGHDQRTSLGRGRSGGAVALDPWLEFMGKAIPYHFESRLGFPSDQVQQAETLLAKADNPFDFERPDKGLKQIEVCRYSLARPNSFCRTMKIWVKEGQEPTHICQACGIEYEEAPARPTILKAEDLPPPASFVPQQRRRLQADTPPHP